MARSAVKTYNRVSRKKTRRAEKRTGKPLTAHQQANVERRTTRQVNRKMARSRGEKTGKGTEHYKGSKRWAQEKGKGKYGSGPSKAKQPAAAPRSRPQRGPRTESDPGAVQPQPQPQIQQGQQPAPFQASAQGPVAQAPIQPQPGQDPLAQYMAMRNQGPYGIQGGGALGPFSGVQLGGKPGVGF